MNKKVLVVAAHPDDEIIGCSGTIARLINEGYEAFTLILGEGLTSRDNRGSKKELELLKEKAKNANKIIGTKNVIFADLPDNKFDSVELLKIVKIVEKNIEKIQPEMIFTHFEGDLNIDHKVTYQAVITAARPLPGSCVKEVYSFEALSSTEWGYPLEFNPDTFFNIESTIKLKIKALKEYDTEIRDFPHPRSLKGVELSSMVWGMKTGLNNAEAFKLVRKVI